jgi:hypothetical protein
VEGSDNGRTTLCSMAQCSKFCDVLEGRSVRRYPHAKEALLSMRKQSQVNIGSAPDVTLVSRSKTVERWNYEGQPFPGDCRLPDCRTQLLNEGIRFPLSTTTLFPSSVCNSQNILSNLALLSASIVEKKWPFEQAMNDVPEATISQVSFRWAFPIFSLVLTRPIVSLNELSPKR